MYGSKRVAVRDLNPHILCALCGGYLIQATTVIECLHSFCRSCIVNFLETSKVCPICDAQIHKTRPLLNIRPDQTLQSLVYKLVPGLFQDEMRRRREFHATLSESDLEDLTLEEKGEASLEREFKPGDDHVSLILQMAFRKNDKKEFKVRDTRYLLCPSEVTVKHLKRFVRCKFQLGENFKIEMFRGGEELTDDLMLQDIALIYSWRGDKPMHICYTVQERASAGSSKVKIKLEQPALTTCREIHKPSPAAVDHTRGPVSPLPRKARRRTTACITAPSTTASSHTSAPPSTVTGHTPGVLTSAAQRLQTAKCSSSSSKPYLISATTKKTVGSQSVTSIICPTATSVTWPTASTVTCPKTSSVSCPTASSTKASPVKPHICSLDSDPRLTQPEVKKESKSSVSSQVGRHTRPSDSPPTLSASWESETAASSVSQLLHSVQSILSKGTKKTVPVVNTLSWTPVSEPLAKQTGDTKLGGDKIDRKVTATLETREAFQPDNHESLKTEALSQVFIKKEADDSAPCEKLASLKSEKCLSLKTESSKQHECDSSKNDAQESLKNESSEREPSKHRRKHKSAKRDKRDKAKHESRKSSKRGRSSEQETGACEWSTQSDNNSCAREKRGTSKSKKRKSSKRSKRVSLKDDPGKSELQKNQPSSSAVESLTINQSSDAPPCEDNKHSKSEGVAGVQRSQSALEKPTSWPSAVGGVSGCPPAAAAGTVVNYQAKESSLTEDTSEDFFHYIPKFQKHRKILPLTRSISCEGQITNPSPVPASNSDAMEKRNWKKRKLSTMDLSSSSVVSNNFSGDYAPWTVACSDKTSEASSSSKVQSVRHTACGVTAEHSSNNLLQPFSEKVPHQSTSSVYQSSAPDRPPASSSSFSCLPFVPPQNGIFTSSFSKQQGKEESSAFVNTSPRDPTPKMNSSNNNEVACGGKNGGGGNDPSTAVSGKNRTAPSRSIKSTARGNPSNASATNGNKPSKHASRPRVTDETPAAMMRSSNIHKSLEEICVEISSSPSDVSSVTSPATDVTSPGTEDRADTSALPEIQSPCDTGCVVHFHGRVGPLDLSSKKKK